MLTISDIGGKTMRRTLVDLEETQIQALDEIASKDRRKSRASLIRDAVDAFLEKNKPEQPHDGYGLWKNKKVDGLDYQEKLRGEW
jgi:predicted transcriptional regulator